MYIVSGYIKKKGVRIMNAQISISVLSGVLPLVGMVIYVYKTHHRVVNPNTTTWALWSLINFVILISYNSASSGDSMWSALVGFIEPFAITVLLITRQGTVWQRLSHTEVVCVCFAIFALYLWWLLKESKPLAQYALYLSILADAIAAIPTIIGVYRKPESDRPVSWALFAAGYGISLCAITEHTFANYALPVYMVLVASSIAALCARHRLKTRAPLMEWV
ncbi:MAG: hypothetical protein WAX38_01130 [Minisyncoccia bacterium]